MNLVLLIGTNPLPNYVVAKYFLKSFDYLKNIFFIHSSGNKFQSSTKEFADNIIEVLKSDNSLSNVSLMYLSLSDIENQKTNYSDLNSGFENLYCNEKVHLNYTGGTKTMGIHVYNFLKDKFKGNFENSYLSAKIFKLVNENGDLISDDLRKEVLLNFKDLIKLHGFIRTNNDFEYGFENAIEKFEEYIEKNEIDKYFESYDRTKFISNSGKLIETSDNLKRKNFSINGKLLEINNLFPKESQLFDSNGQLQKPLPDNKKIKRTIEFIDGKWLEEYFFKILSENLPKNMQIYKNWEFRKPSWSLNLIFELDVIIINGYQLCGVSVTTLSKKAKCKHKGFEIIMRTKQMGGDEAKSILVTRLSEQPVRELQSELEIDTGNTSKNILVLGTAHFQKDNFFKIFKHFMEI